MNLLLSISQTANHKPYRFASGIQVYSFEEALFHCYHYWKKSVDDFLSSAFINWVNDALGLGYMALRIKELREMAGFSVQMLAFLSLTPYFDKTELLKLEPELKRWEERLEWENYKERADDLVLAGEPDKAIPLYRRAIFYSAEEPALFNNIGVAYLQTGEPKEACRYFKEAKSLSPANPEILLHYAESHILAKDFEEAQAAITQAAMCGVSDADILYLQGELAFARNQYADAILFFEKAISGVSSIAGRNQYIFRLADVHAGMRQFEKALEVLRRCSNENQEKNREYMTKEAELLALSGNIPRAIRAMRSAVVASPAYAEGWTRLARYYRQDYNLDKAEESITKALSLDGGYRTRLENARIKKAMGYTKDYQYVLKSVLAELKGRLRDAYS